MPPLRERREDVPQIIDFCLQNLVKQKKTRVTKVAPEAMALLCRYEWPGNVRELENLVYRSAVIAQGDAILVKDLPPEVLGGAGGVSIAPFVPPAATPAAVAPAPVGEPVAVGAVEIAAVASAPVPVAAPAPVSAPALTVEGALDFLHVELSKQDEPLLERLEREMIVRVLKELDGNLARTSERLGMTRATLRKRVEELGLQQS